MKGVDYSTRAADWNVFARALKANGYTFAGRYLSDRAKGLTLEEAHALNHEGVDIFLFYETTETAALEGYNRGAEHARDARRRTSALGVPEAVVYFTVDTDTAGPLVEPYFQGIRSILPLKRIGGYGGYRVVKWLFDNGCIKYACQTQAWSRVDGILTFDPRAQLQQYTVPSYGTSTIEGVYCDLEVATVDDFGQWNLEEPMLDNVVGPTSQQAMADLQNAGLLSNPHTLEYAAGVGLVFTLDARLLRLVQAQTVRIQTLEVLVVRLVEQRDAIRDTLLE